MKKLIFILMVFLLPSCTMLEMATTIGGVMYHTRQIEKRLHKAESICTKQCKGNDNLSEKWCECMQACMVSENIQELFKKFKGKSARIVSDKYILRIKEDGFFNIRIKECEEKYTNN